MRLCLLAILSFPMASLTCCAWRPRLRASSYALPVTDKIRNTIIPEPSDAPMIRESIQPESMTSVEALPEVNSALSRRPRLQMLRARRQLYRSPSLLARVSTYAHTLYMLQQLTQYLGFFNLTTANLHSGLAFRPKPSNVYTSWVVYSNVCTSWVVYCNNCNDPMGDKPDDANEPYVR
jgi:hypothetical protein